MNTVEIRCNITSLKNEAYSMLDKCKEEIRELTSEEQERVDAIKEEIKSLNKELEEVERSLEVADDNDNNTDTYKRNTDIMEFRLLNAINEIANNRGLSDVDQAVVNAGSEEMRKAGLSFSGQIQLPVSELRADITVANTVNAQGDNDVVAVDMYDILAPLRAKNVLVAAGAKFLTGLQGDVQVPVMSASNVTWEGETATAQDGAGSFSSVRLTPKRLTAYIDISKQFLNQTSASAEMLIRQDLINAINSKLEETILGTAQGTTTQPEGLFYNGGSALNVVASYGDIADLEADVEDANISGETSYIMSNKAKAAYRTTPKGSTTGGFIYENGAIDGTPVHNTSNVAGHNVAYGDFSALAIGQWGSVDLTVDPFTVAKDGKVRLVINAYFDAQVLRSGAIVVAKQQ